MTSGCLFVFVYIFLKFFLSVSGHFLSLYGRFVCFCVFLCLFLCRGTHHPVTDRNQEVAADAWWCVSWDVSLPVWIGCFLQLYFTFYTFRNWNAERRKQVRRWLDGDEINDKNIWWCHHLVLFWLAHEASRESFYFLVVLSLRHNALWELLSLG